VLAAAAYASSGTSYKNESSFRVLWRKVKPPGKPDEVCPILAVCESVRIPRTFFLLQGVPFDPDDAMFNPPSPRRSTAVSLTPSYPPVHPQSLQTTTPSNAQPQAQPPPQPQSQPPQPQTQPQTQTQTQAQQPSRGKREPQLQRVIPPEEDMRRLFQECRFAHGNAQLLNEALAYATPEDLREKEIIKV
jgi:hypothetical protein